MIDQIKNIIVIFFSTIISLKSEAIKYIFISGLIALLIFGCMVWMIWSLASTTADNIAAVTPWSWVHESAIFGFIVGIGVILIFLMIMKYIVLIALSPYLSYISEKVEKSLNKDYTLVGFSIAASTGRSIRINTRNMVKEVFITLLLLFVGLIPVLNIFAIPLLFAVQAYFAGFGIMDFYLERHLTFKQTLVEVYKNKYAAMTLGGIFMMLFAIPILGVIVAPYLTTVTGTKYFLKNNQLL